MNQNKFSLFLIVLFTVFSLSASSLGEPKEITTGTLLQEMTDLWRLTRYPEPEYKVIQYSSFDRRSAVPGGPGWFSNSDGFGGEPIPNFERVLSEPDEKGIGRYLIADVKGPGAVVRLWSAAISGHIELFLDQAEEPIYQGEAIDFFHSPLKFFPESKNIEPDLLNQSLYQRDACYFPIPFSKGMRLVWTGNIETIHFYEVQVRVYQKGTKVRTFSPGDLLTHQSTLEKVASILSDPDTELRPRSQKERIFFDSYLEPGQSKELVSLKGPQAVERFCVELLAGDREKALRQTLLSIKCDHHSWGQVQSPIGDFFGASPGLNPYVSLPFTVYPNGKMECRFPMPFKKELKIVVRNQGQQGVKIKGNVLPADYQWDDKRSLHLRARWRVSHNITASNKAVQDLPFLIACGKGLYAGTTSFVLNPNPVPISYGNWWGEGDEKIFIDGESFPSLFGTGSEDYYNYSWSSPDIFYFPYCGQPRNDGPGNRGFVTNFRWHVMDALPFKENIRFYMELFSHEKTPGMSYARIGYHYARPGITDDHEAIMREDLRELKLADKWEPAARMGARDSIFYSSEDIITDWDRVDIKEGRLWAEAGTLVWKPQEKKSVKEFEFEVKHKGKYRVYATLGMTPQSGVVSFMLDRQQTQTAGGENKADLYRPFRVLLRNFRLKDTEFSPGVHRLGLVYERAHPDIKEPEVNIDFIWVQRIKE